MRTHPFVAGIALACAAPSLLGQGAPYLVRDVNAQSSSPTALHAPSGAFANTLSFTGGFRTILHWY